MTLNNCKCLIYYKKMSGVPTPDILILLLLCDDNGIG